MLPRRHRLSRKEFDRVFLAGKNKYSSFFRVKYLPNNDFKLAFVVPKKLVKGAVIRNKLRRQLYQILPSSLKTGQFVLVLKTYPFSVSEVEKDIEQLIR